MHGTTPIHLARKPPSKAAQTNKAPAPLTAKLAKALQRPQHLHVDTPEPFDVPRRRHDVGAGIQDRRPVFHAQGPAVALVGNQHALAHRRVEQFVPRKGHRIPVVRRGDKHHPFEIARRFVAQTCL
jgi:hypothetical protein